MLFKIIHERDEAGEFKRNPDGSLILKHVKILLPFMPPQHLWMPEFLERAQKEGWLKVRNVAGETYTSPTNPRAGELLVFLADRPCAYRITNPPGLYSCYTGERLPDKTAAIKHVAQQKAPSPDPQNPSGYRRMRWFESTLEA